MLNRLILKVTKFYPPPPKHLGTVVKNILGAIMPPMSNRVKQFFPKIFQLVIREKIKILYLINFLIYHSRNNLNYDNAQLHLR